MGLPPICIYVMNVGLHFILIMLACVWVVRGYMLHKPMGHAQFSLEFKQYFKVMYFANKWSKCIILFFPLKPGHFNHLKSLIKLFQLIKPFNYN